MNSLNIVIQNLGLVTKLVIWITYSDPNATINSAYEKITERIIDCAIVKKIEISGNSISGSKVIWESKNETDYYNQYKDYKYEGDTVWKKTERTHQRLNKIEKDTIMKWK